MRKIFQFFSLLVLSCFGALGVSAQESKPITALDQTDNASAYTIESFNRGYLVYAPSKTKTGAWCSKNTWNGGTEITVDPKEPDNQWMFYKIGESYYLYNVGANKFLYKSGGGTMLTEYDPAYTVQLLPSTGINAGTHPTNIAFDGNKINLSLDQNPSVVFWHDTGDNGNTMQIVKVPDVSPDVQALVEAQVKDYQIRKEYNERFATYKTLYTDALALYWDGFQWSKNLFTNPSQFTSQFTEPWEGSVAGACDNDVTTFWHSKWSGGSVTPGTHDFFIALPEAVGGDMKLAMTRRRTGADHITAFDVYASNNAADYTFVGTVETPFTSNTETVTGHFTVPVGTVSLRFVIAKTTTGNGFGHFAEFQLYHASLSPDCVNAKYPEQAEALRAAIVEAKAVIEKGAMAVTQDVLDKFQYVVKKSQVCSAAEKMQLQSVAPANATTVNYLDKLTLTFDQAVGFVVPAGQVFDGLAVLNEQGEAVTTAALYQGEEENTVVVELAEPVVVEGNYSLSIPEQYVWNSLVNLEDEDFLGYFEGARYNEAVALSYSVVPGPQCAEADADAEKVQKVYDEFTTVQLHFNEAVSYNGQGVTLSKLRGESYVPAVSVEGQTVTLTFADGPKNPAIYVLDVQEGAFTSVEKQRPNDAFTVRYKLLQQPDSFSFTEAEPIVGTTVKSLSTILLTFPEAVGFVVPAAQANLEETALQVLNEQGEVVTGAVINTLEDNRKAVEIVLAETINVDGNYSLTVPAQYIWNEGFNADEDDFGVENYFAVHNPEFTLKYKVVSSDGPTLEYPALLPVENSKVAELSEVHMTFTSAVKYNEEKKIYAYNKATNVMYEATVSFGTVTSSEDGEEYELSEGADVYVRFAPAIAEPGVYELVVPANTFMDKNTLLNSVLRYEFTVVAAENSFVPEFTKVFMEEAQDVALVFSEKVGFVTEEVVDGTALTLKKNGQVAPELSATVYFDKYNLNVVHVLFSEPIKDFAAYTVEIPEKTIWNALYDATAADCGVAEGALYNPALTLDFTVESPLSVTESPATGVVESIESVAIAFSDAVTYNEEKAVTLINMTTRTEYPVSVEVSEEGVVTVTPAEPVTDYGYYTLSVPQGAFFTETGFENETLVYQFKINREKSDIFVCTGAAPADGTTVSKLERVKLSFGETVGALAPDATNQGVKVLNADGQEFLARLELDGNDWNAVNLVLVEPITAAGNYTVSIPAGYVWNNDADAKEEDFGVEKNFAIYNPEFTLNYTVAPLNPVAVTPESESRFELDSENIFYVQLTFPEDVVYNENAENPIRLVSKAARTPFYPTVLPAGENRSQMTLVFEGVTAGNYTLFVPAGTFSSVSGERWCEDLVYYYTLTKPADSFKYTAVEPADGTTVAELSTVTFSWPDWTCTGTDLGDNQVVPMLLNADGSEVEGHTLSIGYDGYDSSKTVVTISPALTEAGTYTLLLPEKTVYDNNYGDPDIATYNPEFTLTYTIAAAEDDGLPKDGKTYYIVGEFFGKKDNLYVMNSSNAGTSPVAWLCTKTPEGKYVFTAGGNRLMLYSNSEWVLEPLSDYTAITVPDYVKETVDISKVFVVRSGGAEVQQDDRILRMKYDGSMGTSKYPNMYTPWSESKFTSYYKFVEANYDGRVVVTESANYQEEVTVSFEEAQNVAVTDNLFGVMFDQDGEITAVAYTSEEESMGIFVEDEANVNVTFNRLQDLSYEQYEYACQMATEIDFNQEAGKAAVYFRPNSFRVDGVKYDKEISKCYAVDGNGTTGIETVKTESADDIFDLQGRRVVKPVKGNLYIKNGEKLLK